MKVRQLRRARNALTSRHIKAVKAGIEESYLHYAEVDDYDYDYDEERDYDCTHCGGEGFREVDDPFWDQCDEYGYGPCGSCNGTGLRSRQTIF